MKYFKIKNWDYDGYTTDFWEVKDEYCEDFLALNKVVKFGDLISVSNKKPNKNSQICSFDEYLTGKAAQISEYIKVKKNQTAWQKLVNERGYFSGASFGVDIGGTIFVADEDQRWKATMGLNFIMNTEELIDTLNKVGLLKKVIATDIEKLLNGQ